MKLVYYLRVGVPDQGSPIALPDHREYRQYARGWAYPVYHREAAICSRKNASSLSSESRRNKSGARDRSPKVPREAAMLPRTYVSSLSSESRRNKSGARDRSPKVPRAAAMLPRTYVSSLSSES